MLNITDKIIMEYLQNPKTYEKGLLYLIADRVKSFEFDEGYHAIDAKVVGGDVYDVEIFLSPYGGINQARCTCPAYAKGDEPCKHIAAVLKKAQIEFHPAKKRTGGDANGKGANQNSNQNIFSFFENYRDDVDKREIKMEVIYELAREYSGMMSSMEIRIGESRMYVVRSIKDFVSALQNNRTIEFGKNFSFNPYEYTFSGPDKPILDLIFELYENEKILQNPYMFHSSNASIFKGKKVFLSDLTLKRFFNIMKDRTFEARILEEKIPDMFIVHEPLPLEFELKQKKEDVVLEWSLKHTLVPLTKDGEYFFYDGKVYSPPTKQVKYFAPLYKTFTTNKQKKLSFSSWEKERFVSEILPFVKSIGAVHIEPEVEARLFHQELNAQIYLDKIEQGISAVIEFHYGDKKINPFIGKQTISYEDKILIREVERERKIIANFDSAGFKVQKDRIYLDDDDKMFDFIYQILPKLQELAEIFYSEAFKNMSVRQNRSFVGGVRLNEQLDMLELSLELEGVDGAELKRVFESVREKKKYHRLKDGSFISLDIAGMERVAELVDSLDISDKELKKKTIALPKYRAMYIDSSLKEGHLSHIEKNAAFNQLVQNIKEPWEMEFEVPEKLQPILRDYQKVGFMWLKTLAAYGMGGILADDMGLGKTLQTIAFILSEREKKSGPCLVVAPTSLVYNWQDEVNKFAPELKTAVIYGQQKERQQMIQEVQDADIIITSYPLIRRDIELYEQFQFAYCFLDEAQHIKNPNTQNAQSVKQIRAKACFALTGTPIENSLIELWSIFDFILPGYLLSHGKFSKKYEKPIIKDKDEKALEALGHQIRPFILRRMKKDVLKELPEKIESKMTAELTEAQKKIYLAYLNEARGEINQELQDKGFEKSQIKILAALTRLRQICCHPATFIENYEGESGKLLLLQEILEDALGAGHRILLFSQFTSMLHLIRSSIEAQGISYFYLDGSTKVEDRRQMVKEFEKGKGQVFLISLKAGGTGLNLTGADMVIHYDPWWNPAVEDQATDRAYRIGQKNMVQVMKLITKDTIEEKIFMLQQKKKEMIESVIQPGETMISKMTEAEIKALFDI